MIKLNNKFYKLFEIFTLTLSVPIIIIFFNLQKYVILFLIITCLTISITSKKKILKNDLPKNKKIYVRLIIKDIFLIIFLVIILREFKYIKALSLDIKNLIYLANLALIYLIFSVIPQEIIFRYYFFHRYKKIFLDKYVLVIVNSIIFSSFHIIYFNFEIILFTFVGSLFFSYNYIKYKSLTLVILEHFLFGQILIITGFFDQFKYSFIKSLYKILIIN